MAWLSQWETRVAMGSGRTHQCQEHLFFKIGFIGGWDENKIMLNKDALFERQNGLLQLLEAFLVSSYYCNPCFQFPRSWPWSPRRAPRHRGYVLVQWSSLVNQRKPMSLNGKMLAETVALITLLFPQWQNSRRRMKSGFPSLKWKKWKLFMRSLNFMLIFSFGKEKSLNYQSHTLQIEIESAWFRDP